MMTNRGGVSYRPSSHVLPLLVTGQKVTARAHPRSRSRQTPKKQKIPSSSQRVTPTCGNSYKFPDYNCPVIESTCLLKTTCTPVHCQPDENYLALKCTLPVLAIDRSISYFEGSPVTCLKAKSAIPHKKPSSQRRKVFRDRCIEKLPESPSFLQEEIILNNQGLTSCSIVERQTRLRSFSCKNNRLSEISHLDSLVHLVHLDMCNNCIQHIRGLERLESLKVLLLRQNVISKIEGLQYMQRLEILDLQDNRIAVIENLSKMNSLKHLNLAGNNIQLVQNLHCLPSLVKLELQRNKIVSIVSLDGLPSLRKLLLDYNNITSLVDIGLLTRVPTLQELNLAGNPVISHQRFSAFINQYLPNLKLLDVTLKCTDEDSEPDLNMEYLKEYRRQMTMAAIGEDEVCESMSNQMREKASEDGGSNCEEPSWHCEVQKTTLILSRSGIGTTVGLQRNWGLRINPTITTIKFHGVDFNEVVRHLDILHPKYPNFSKLELCDTSIKCLMQLNYLVLLGHLDSLNISEGNPVTELPFWKPYLLFRLAHFPLKSLNEVEVTAADIHQANLLFDDLSSVEEGNNRFMSRKGSLLDENLESAGAKCDDEEDGPNCIVQLHVEGSRVVPLPSLKSHKIESVITDLSSKFVDECFEEATVTCTKMSMLREAWPDMFQQMVIDGLVFLAEPDNLRKMLADMSTEILNH